MSFAATLCNRSYYRRRGSSLSPDRGTEQRAFVTFALTTSRKDGGDFDIVGWSGAEAVWSRPVANTTQGHWPITKAIQGTGIMGQTERIGSHFATTLIIWSSNSLPASGSGFR